MQFDYFCQNVCNQTTLFKMHILIVRIKIRVFKKANVLSLVNENNVFVGFFVFCFILFNFFFGGGVNYNIKIP